MPSSPRRLIALWIRCAAALLLASGTAIWIGSGPAEAADPEIHPRWTAPIAGPLDVERGADLPTDLASRPWQPAHRGADLLAAVGDPVFAAGAGVVVFAGGLAGRGVVSVEHPATAHAAELPPLRTTYEPVEALVVSGEHVEAGEVIGIVQVGGAHCATTCLHWGLRRGDSYLDPLGLLRARTVRLLPHLAGLAAEPPSTAAVRADLATTSPSAITVRLPASSTTAGPARAESASSTTTVATAASAGVAAAAIAWSRRRTRP